MKSSAVRIAAAVSALGLGMAGFAGTASAAMPTPFEVCSPLGCAAQSVRGTVETVGGQVRVVATVSDSAPSSSLTAQFVLSGKTTEARRIVVNDETRQLLFTSLANPVTLTVTACGGGGCNTKSFTARTIATRLSGTISHSGSA